MLWHLLQLLFVGVLVILSGLALFLDLLGYMEGIEKHLPWLGRVMKHRAIIFALLLFSIGLLLKDFHNAIATAPAPQFTIRISPPTFQTHISPAGELKNSLRRRTIRLVNDLTVFWSHRPVPPQQPVQNPSTDEERQRNATWDQYWREATIAYDNANFRERILGIIREYKAKGVPTGSLEQGVEQPNRLIGAGAFGGTSLENCFNYMSELCVLRELAYHVDANDAPIFLTPKPQKL